MTKFWHGHHTHNSQHELDLCEARTVRDNTRYAIKAGFVLLVMAAMLAALSCLYAQLTYGDWTCGLPGVECRKMIEP